MDIFLEEVTFEITVPDEEVLRSMRKKEGCPIIKTV